MTPTIKATLDKEISLEGGFVNHPNDKGGPTKYGITIATLSNYLGRIATLQDVQNLTVDLAEEIFYKNYYVNPRLELLPEGLQALALDTAILHGPKWAVSKIQSIVNQTGFGPIDQDGVLGPETSQAVNTAYAKMGPWFNNALVEEREMFYNDKVANDPSQKVFLQGWINRAEQFKLPIGA